MQVEVVEFLWKASEFIQTDGI